MLTIYAKVDGEDFPRRVTNASRLKLDAQEWWAAKAQEIVVIDIPEEMTEYAVDLLRWFHTIPALMQVMAVLTEDGIPWRMWSIENDSRVELCTPINADDLQFLKSLKVSWDENAPTENQSGLHLV